MCFLIYFTSLPKPEMKNLAPLQTISIVGVILTLVAHIILLIRGKEIPDFWYIYPTWVFIFFLGWLLRKIFGSSDHHHH